MAIYEKYADTPDRLKQEGDEITVKLVRNGDGTATIKWNIPNIAGCNVEDLMYDGIIITVSSRPANYITTSPHDNTYYNADPTFDHDLFSGDSINVADVVGAFYHDRVTVSLEVADIKEKTPYYVSAYAVDAQGHYHREGVHAYSLPTAEDELDKSGAAGPATHDIQIDTIEGISVKALTGLRASSMYNLKIEVNGICHDFTNLQGGEMQTYEDMAALINRQFKLLANPLLGPLYPNEGKYMVDEPNKKVYLWDGTQNVEQPSIFLLTDPALPILGSYWYKPSTGELSVRDSAGWVLISDTNIVPYPTDPSQPADGTIWFEKILNSAGNLDTVNSTGWSWNDSTWCKQPTIIQPRNPLLPPILTGGDYWYNETDGTISQRNVDFKRWDEVDPIVWDLDPNTISDNDYWYNTGTELVYIRLAGLWDDMVNIRYEEPDAEGELPYPVATHYWFIPSEQRLFYRDPTNTFWTEIDVIIAAMDPAVRDSCDLWWDVTPLVDSLFIWDELNGEWDAVNSFTQSIIDPALPPVLEPNTLWYNPTTGVMQKINGLNCTDVDYICSPYDPTDPPVGYIWNNTTDGTWYIWDGVEYVLLDVMESESDPFGVTDGVFWFDGTELQLRELGVWVPQIYTEDSLAPPIGTYFLDTIDYTLYQWDGVAWVEACGVAQLKLLFNREVCFDEISAANSINNDIFSPYNDVERYGRDLMRFETCDVGCEQSIAIDLGSTVLTGLNVPLIHYTPSVGRSIDAAGPTFRELGVGTDGTPDERRKLQDRIRIALGAPNIQVELTKQELDECIDNALLMVRKYSSYSYQRSFFFLDIFPNQQRYILTNKCVGFNQIINVNAAYRMRTGFLGASMGGGNTIFGIAALQQLYSLGRFDMLSYHLISSYLEDLSYIFADNLVFDFYEDTRALNFHQVFYGNERVLLDATIEMSEQHIMTNRYLELWVKKWAVSEAKMILSQVRGKFSSLPGPNGSTVLNSQELITQAENEQSNLREEIMDRSFQDHNSDVSSQFFIG